MKIQNVHVFYFNQSRLIIIINQYFVTNFQMLFNKIYKKKSRVNIWISLYHIRLLTISLSLYYIYRVFFFLIVTLSNRMFWKQDIVSTIWIILRIYHLPDGNLTMHTAKYQYFLTILYWFRHNYCFFVLYISIVYEMTTSPPYMFKNAVLKYRSIGLFSSFNDWEILTRDLIVYEDIKEKQF